MIGRRAVYNIIICARVREARQLDSAIFSCSCYRCRSFFFIAFYNSPPYQFVILSGR